MHGIKDVMKERFLMKRAEAIKVIETICPFSDAYTTAEMKQALEMAVNAIAVYVQYKWERDIALSQLEEYGIGFGEKKRDMVEVVRCKDCKYSKVYGKTTQWLACENVIEQATDPDGYCDHGERREL